MTYDRWHDLASRPDLTFGVAALPAGDAWWLPDVPGIALDVKLSRVGRRCALAHELVHADHNDQQCAHLGPGAARTARRHERHADEVAAARLIPLDALADALRWALSNEEVAEALDVTVHLARVRVRSLSTSDKAYIEARIAGEERGIA